jgi:hypothetical protein
MGKNAMRVSLKRISNGSSALKPRHHLATVLLQSSLVQFEIFLRVVVLSHH